MSNVVRLEWTDFQVRASTSFPSVRENQEFSDVTLACDDDTLVPAHKIVLSAGSSFFHQLLRRLGGQPHPLLYIKGVSGNQLEAVLDFIYCGEVSLPQTQLQSFLQVAKELELLGLAEEDKSKQMQAITNQNESIKTINNFFEETKLESHMLKPMVENEFSFSNADIEIKLKPEVKSTSNESDTNFLLEQGIDDQSINHNINTTYNINQEPKQYKCEQCVFEAKHYSTMITHKRKHDGTALDCNKCEYSTYSTSCLLTHKKTKHEGVRYKCDKCDHYTTRKFHLISHIQTKHDKESFICGKCVFATLSKTQLQRHERQRHQ